MSKILLLLGLLAGVSYTVYCQPSIQAIQASVPPIINGNLDDECWKSASVVTALIQREPKPGLPVSENTQILICYDADHIYVGIKCFDDPQKVTAKEMARDANLANDDRVQVILDTYLNHRTGYWFQIGPRGSIGDATISENGAVFNKEWDGLWEGKARIVADGWEAEMAIPFKTIGFNKNIDTWGIKFIRHIKRKLESSYWPSANLNSYKFQVSDAGFLKGINKITQGIGLDISPYLVGGMNTHKGVKNDYQLKGGVDMFYQITPGLKSSLTINTDFAETEVDDRQINLTRFDLLFPEKRDFFLDGSSNFSFGIQGDDNNGYGKTIIPFFSRRMGLNTNGTPIPINYAARLTGSIGKWNLGLMQVNDEHPGNINNFSVARISRNLGPESSVGVIGTYGNAVSPNQNWLTGSDFRLSTSKFMKNKILTLIGFGLKSNTKGLVGKDYSWGGNLSYPNDFFSFMIGHHEIGQNFVAGMGFVPRTNIKDTYGNVRFGPRPNRWGMMQIYTGFGFDHVSDFQNVLQTRTWILSPITLRFKSGEELAYSITNSYEYLVKDFNIFSNYVIAKDRYDFWRQSVKVTTAGGRNLSGDVSYVWGDFYTGYRKDFSVGANYKVCVPLFFGVRYKLNQVNLPVGNFAARIYQFNLNLLISPSLTLYNYLQYDNLSDNIGVQSRFQWIVKPGNEIIVAWTSNFSQPLERYVMTDSALRFKLKYNFRF